MPIYSFKYTHQKEKNEHQVRLYVCCGVVVGIIEHIKVVRINPIDNWNLKIILVFLLLLNYHPNRRSGLLVVPNYVS